MRAAGEPPPEPRAPAAPQPLRLGQAARLVLMLGPGDVPARAEYLRMASRSAAACGGWAELRGFLDTLDLTTPDARRALRAAVGALQPKALGSRRAWNALRARAPRLPEAQVVGVGEPAGGHGGDEASTAPRRRRRRRRLRAVATEAPSAAASTTSVAERPETAGGGGEAAAPRRRRRRRRRPARPLTEAVPGPVDGGPAAGTDPAAVSDAPAA
jgi:hypothetical protein